MRAQQGRKNASDLTTAFPLSGEMAEKWAESSRAYLYACLEWQKELADFTNERLAKDLDLQRAAIKCKTAGELAKLHQEWVDTTLKDYVRETERLTSLFQEATLNGMQTTKRAAETGSAGDAEK